MSLIRRRYANRLNFQPQRPPLGRRWTTHRDPRQLWLEFHGGYPFRLIR
jgi:hypothetical protein